MGRTIAIAAAALLVLLAGGCSGDESSAEPTATQTEAPPPSSPSPPPSEAEPTEEETASSQEELPPLSIELEGCTSATQDQVDAIEALFIDERADTLRLAYAATAGDRTYIGGTTYRPMGSRLYSSDVWALEGGEVFALSGSAQEITDVGELGPGAISTAEADLVEACASDALLPPESRRFVDNLQAD